MECLKCSGTGAGTYVRYEGRKKFVLPCDCNDCKGTGQAAQAMKDSVAFCDNVWLVPLYLPYTNTASKLCACEVSVFVIASSSRVGYPEYFYPLKQIWFRGTDIITGAAVYAPFWKSITLKKTTKNE